MKSLFIGLAGAALLAAPTYAATMNAVTVTPGATITLPPRVDTETSQYDQQNLPGDPDPLSIGNVVGIANTLVFNVPYTSPVQITLRGGEAADRLGFRIGGAEIFNTGTRGSVLSGLTVRDLIDAQFFDPRDSGGFGLNSATVAIVAFSNTIELAFNQIGFDGDYDDMRIKASVAPIPVPAALPLLATGLLALYGIRRRSLT